MTAPQTTSPNPESSTQLHAAEFSSPAPDTEPRGSVGAGSTIIGHVNSATTDHQNPIGLGLQLNTTPSKPDTEAPWGAPAGLHMRRPNDENLAIFRQAVGINSHLNLDLSNINNNLLNSATTTATDPAATTTTDPASLEAGRRTATAATAAVAAVAAGGGIYAAARGEVRRKALRFHLLSFVINASHVSQIVIGASLTALGPGAGNYVVAITLLGAINTVIAGLLALIKGQGLPDRLYHDRAEFRRVQDWIEQTEALLAVGVIGRDRKEVGLLVQTAFKKYNAAKHCEESNLPENYVPPPEPAQVGRPVPQGSQSPPSHAVRPSSPYH